MKIFFSGGSSRDVLPEYVIKERKPDIMFTYIEFHTYRHRKKLMKAKGRKCSPDLQVRRYKAVLKKLTQKEKCKQSKEKRS